MHRLWGTTVALALTFVFSGRRRSLRHRRPIRRRLRSTPDARRHRRVRHDRARGERHRRSRPRPPRPRPRRPADAGRTGDRRRTVTRIPCPRRRSRRRRPSPRPAPEPVDAAAPPCANGAGADGTRPRKAAARPSRSRRCRPARRTRRSAGLPLVQRRAAATRRPQDPLDRAAPRARGPRARARRGGRRRSSCSPHADTRGAGAVSTRLLGRGRARRRGSLLAVGPQPATAAETITAHCTPAPENCSGWYTTNVTVQWTWDAGGAAAELPLPHDLDRHRRDAGELLGVVQRRPGADARGDDPARRDAAPGDGASRRRGRPTRAAGTTARSRWPFTGSDATSGIASCTSPQYAGPDGASRDVSGHVHGRRRQHERARRHDAEVRRDAAGGDRRAGARPRRERLVQPRRRDHGDGNRSRLGRRLVQLAVLLGPRQRRRVGQGDVHRQRGEHERSRRDDAEVRRDRPHDLGEGSTAGPSAQRLVPAPLKVTFAGDRRDVRDRVVHGAGAYKGPDDAAATLAGTCRDAAGNSERDLDRLQVRRDGAEARGPRRHERERARARRVAATRRTPSPSSSCAGPA